MVPERMAIVRFMEFGVLGPLRVIEHDRAFPLGGPKQRALLALLIAGAGTPVSTDSLIMGVYGPDGDAKNLRSIQTYISTFKRSLGDVITRTGDSYELGVDPETIDAVRFERLIDRARSAVNSSRSAEALYEALDLWRGDPYCDVEAPGSLQTEIRRLKELRAEALEARIDLDLAIGRHHELIAELESLVATYPLREGLRSRQMVALYRCGRQADALRVCREAGDHMRRTVGLDISKDLRRLEQKILEQDDELGYHPGPRARPEPARYTSFVGRDAEIRHVVANLETHRLVTITGPGGIGKSSLAAEVARELAESVATVYVPIERQRSTDPLVLIAGSLGLAPSGGSDVLATVSHALDGVEALVLLDGCEHIIDQLPSVVDELLGRCPTTRFLITSQERLSIPGEVVFALGPLDEGDNSASNQLLADRAGFALDALTAEDLEKVTEIGQRLSGMPLALELAAARWRTMSLSDIVAQLDDQMVLLATKRGVEERHLSIVAALDWSYELFGDATQEAFRRLSVFRGEVPVKGARFVLEVDDPTVILEELIDLSAMTACPNKQYRMLEPIRQFALQKLEESGELNATRLRHAAWVIECCRWIDHELNVARLPTALPVLRSEGPEIVTVAAWALEQDRPEVVLSIVAAVGRIWWQALDPRLIQDIAIAALDHPRAPTGDLAIRALAHAAFLHRTTDKTTTRMLMSRLESVSGEATDPATRVTVLQMRALLSHHDAAIYGADDHDSIIDERLALLDESLRIAEGLGLPVEPEFYNKAYLLEALGRFDEADEALQSLHDWAGDSDPVNRGAALIRMAISKIRRSSHSEGVDMAREATRLLLETGQLSMAADAEWVQSYGLFYLGQYQQGLRALYRGDEYYRLVGMPPARVWNPIHFAMFAAALERWDDVEATINDYLGRVPDTSQPTARRSFLLGHPSLGSRFIRALYPAARWLISQGRYVDAAKIVAAAPLAQQETGLSEWDLDAVLGLAEELTEYPVEEYPMTLEDLFSHISLCFRAKEAVIE